MIKNTYLAYGECYQVMPREAVQRDTQIAVLSGKKEDTAKKHCPPCEGNCNQGRSCSAQKGGA